MWALAALLFFQAVNPASEGLKAMQEGKYDVAVQVFTKAIEADPQDYSAHFNLALAYTLLHRDAEALPEYRKTLELKPGLYEAQLNEGIVLLRDKNAADALPLLEAAAAQKTREFRPRYFLAEAQLATGAVAKAEESYRAAAELDPKSAGAQMGIAHSLARQGRAADAAPYFRQAARLDPEYRDGLLELAALYETQGQRAEAAEIYKDFPDNPAAQERLGELLLDSKQYADAIPRLEQAYAKSPTEANRAALAAAYLFDNHREKALPLLQKAVAEEPANYDLRLMYARALRDQRQFQPSAQQFSAALKMKPDAGPIWDELGGVLYMLDDYQQSLAAFDHALKLGQNIAGNWFLRAIILDKMRQIKPALEAYERFLSMSEGKHPDQEFQARQRARILKRELEKR